MSVARWVEERVPPVPAGFRPWLVESLGEVPAEQAALAREAEAALRRSVSGQGARDGAFELLVADALATWAAQAILDSEDAERGLDELVGALAG